MTADAERPLASAATYWRSLAQKSPENGIIVKDIVKFPGPGQYEYKKDTLSTIAYTCRPRTIDFIGTAIAHADKKITFRKNPGPGAYEYVEAFPQDGRTLISKFTSTKFAKINHSQRFTESKDSPGPHTYDNRNNFSTQGKYLLSNNRGDGTRAFSQTARVGFTETIAKNSISTAMVMQVRVLASTNGPQTSECTATASTTKRCQASTAKTARPSVDRPTSVA